MELNITKLSGTEQEAEVKLDWNELEPYFEEAYKKFRAKAEIKGFRKGKAPMELIKRQFGEQIEYEALDDVVNNVYQNLVKDKKIEPVGTPELVDIDYKRGESLTFKIKYEIIPDFQISNYEGLEIEKIVHTVDDKEVENEIKRLLIANASYEEADEVKGELYRVTVDLQGVDQNNLPVLGKRSEDVVIDLDDDSVVKNLRERLLRAKKGDEFTIEITIDNKPEKVRVFVKKIEKKILPELNDEFASKVTGGKVNSVNELKDHLKTELQKWWDEYSDIKFYDNIIIEIVRTNDFPVPESLVEDFIRSMLDEEKSKYPDGKLPENFDEQLFRQKKKADAVFSAKWYIIKNKIAQIEGIELTDEDFEKLAEEDSAEIGIEKEKLLSFYKSSEHIREKILNRKVLRFLKDKVKVVERFV
ncbi:MAG: trigger factor [Candidatus Kryptonium sp.]|nr:trigger factor [Candidatus Kryptonium sp.]MCX7762040.1 trigger factor [Candidatus Kryptonium sp.]MDW8108356.1 trigger factor [Candidatus Kryptonium sp.]